MLDVIYIVLLLMIGLFFLWLPLKNILYKMFKFKICAVCAMVSSTWALLLTLTLLGYKIPVIIIAILMGQSIAGFMYIVEKKISKKDDYLQILKPAIIILGTLFVYMILTFVYG